MQLSVSGKHIDVGDALRGHVSTILSTTAERYFGSAIEAKVSFARERHLFRSDISVHAARGLLVQSHGEAPDAYAAFDTAIERMETRLQRYKGRLIGRRKDRRLAGEQVETAQHYVLATDSAELAEDPENGRAAVVAELVSEIAVLPLSEAVMQLDLGDLPILMFRNRSHGRLNVVYRRRDGSIGWVDPQEATASPSNSAA